MTTREAKTTQPPVVRWVRHIERGFEAEYMQPPRRGLLQKMAGVIAIVGQPDNQQARQTYHALIPLFAHRKRRSRWTKAVDLIPADRQRILRITECVRAYNQQIENKTKVELSSAKFKLDRVIKTMMEIPDAGPYIDWCRDEGIYHPGAIFHPNTLDQAKDDLKGVFGYAERMEYGNQLDDTEEKTW